MKKYLIKFMPFWSSNVIGIVSKLCLTYTTIILGLFMGIISVIYGIIVFFGVLPYINQILDLSKASLIIKLILHSIFYVLFGLSYIYHYVFAKKGFELKDPKYIKKSYIMFCIAWFMYEYTRYGISLITLISAGLVIIIFTIPLNKAKNAFKNDLLEESINE